MLIDQTTWKTDLNAYSMVDLQGGLRMARWGHTPFLYHGKTVPLPCEFSLAMGQEQTQCRARFSKYVDRGTGFYMLVIAMRKVCSSKEDKKEAGETFVLNPRAKYSQIQT